eukprot:GFUD01037469.1.p1 GENE.GFUD01037469.1~~GFUD01037469.1.p1  ORF type:complete len:462 (-),score=138.23 GFUD01037469.1:36-1421(-)
MFNIEQKVRGKGRCLTARCNISPGDLVFSEKCLFWGPVQTSGSSICVSCLDGTCMPDPGVCLECGYTLCQTHQEPARHKEECQLLAISGWSSAKNMEDQLLVLTVIRCLLTVRDENMDMMAVRGFMDVARMEWLVKRIVQTGKWGEEEILLATKCVLYNCLDVLGKDGSPLGRGLYPTACLLEHSCTSNTRNIIIGDSLECRATVHIPEGETITTCLVSPLLDVFTRRKELKEKFNLNCSCPRCCSPTELGSFSSALCCLACENILGYFLPPDPADTMPQYTCNKCQYQIPEKLAIKATQELIPIVQEYNMFGIEEQEDFLDSLLTKFHENHSLILQLKLNICKELGRDDYDSLEGAENDTLERKTEFCEELLAVMDIIEPGLSVVRGTLLYELADAIMVREGRHGKDIFEDEDSLENKYEACEKYLSEAMKCLENDRDDKLKQLCMKIKKMRHDLYKVRQ